MENTFSNGIPVNSEFRDALIKYAEYARRQGCECTDEEIFAAFEVIIMKAAGIQPTDIAIEKSRRFLSEIEKN